MFTSLDGRYIPVTTLYYTGKAVRYLQYNGPIKKKSVRLEDGLTDEERKAKRASERRNKAVREIENALAFMLSYSFNRPLLMVLTIPPGGKVKNQISKFLRNYQTNFQLNYYVWVKELGGTHGRLHYHLCADMPFRDIRLINNYWSKLFGSKSKCSVRMHKGKNRFLHGASGWRYFSKYITKDFDASLGRSWAISTKLRSNAKPVTISQADWPNDSGLHFDWSKPNEHGVCFAQSTDPSRAYALRLLDARKCVLYPGKYSSFGAQYPAIHTD